MAGQLTTETHFRGLPISSEMAADPRYIPRLLALGIQTVSVSARLIPGVRRAVTETLAGRIRP